MNCIYAYPNQEFSIFLFQSEICRINITSVDAYCAVLVSFLKYTIK